MGTAGIIFGVIVVAWVTYLVPSFLNRRNCEDYDLVDADQRFSESMKIIHRSRAEEDSSDPFLEISTPLTRAAAMAEIRIAYRTAANRRLRGTVALLVATAAVFIAAFFFPNLGFTSALVPFGLLVVWLGLCRFNNRTLTASLDERVSNIRTGWTDETIAIPVGTQVPTTQLDDPSEFSVELTAPIGGAPSLWDLIPVTPATYVQHPTAARTIRTIDLGAPVTGSYPLPPTAEAPDQDVSEQMAEPDAEAV